MVLPPGHGQALAAPRRLATREKRMVRAVLGVVVAILIVLLISILTTGSSSAHGCIHATIPGAVGAQEIDECGAQARSTCLTAERPGSFPAASARVVAAECRKAGIPVG